ncbi:beta-lactamase class A [Rhizomicrobium palustre]|uniref:beta-lactamase n=1 Tax=Rhizomicrobium palustre TaxID=189966 RepID=A0A846MZI6_9PROT|nr:class A beta-lactamase [Rhizomicrobium palustre]NIK88723.1 beta-lactamase class A [Rhizomicrobium palustre]
MDRRVFLWTSSLALVGVAGLSAAKELVFPRQEGLLAAVTLAEKTSGGRLGVAVIDTGSGARFSYRGSERFPLCSTFKLLLVTAVLCKVDAGAESLERRVAVKKGDILGNSPFSAQHVGTSASLGELSEATITLSDNTAANLLLPAVGGPEGLTKFLAEMGDSVTRIDRYEPIMSSSIAHDLRDTTTPEAMAATVQKFVLGTVLKPASLALLQAWLRATKTGSNRLRAGLPADWQVGDKTGTGDHGTSNDVAVIWPPHRAPLVVASYVNESKLSDRATQHIHAEVGKAIAAAV